MILWNQEHWKHFMVHLSARKKTNYSVTYFSLHVLFNRNKSKKKKRINLWGNSSVLLNCRFYGPVATLILENLLEDCFLATQWERPFQLMQDYQKHFFFKFRNNEALLVWWPRNAKCNFTLVARTLSQWPMGSLLSAILTWDQALFLLFASLLLWLKSKNNSSSRKQITEIKGEGMIAGYCYSCSQFLPTPPPINNY